MHLGCGPRPRWISVLVPNLLQHPRFVFTHQKPADFAPPWAWSSRLLSLCFVLFSYQRFFQVKQVSLQLHCGVGLMGSSDFLVSSKTPHTMTVGLCKHQHPQLKVLLCKSSHRKQHKKAFTSLVLYYDCY